MGQMKNLMIQRMDEDDDEQLAHKLGITHDELLELDHAIETDESEDGIVYNYIIRFGSSAPPEILSKVRGIDRNNTVYLTTAAFESDYYYEEQYLAIISNKEYYESFLQSIHLAKKMNDIKLQDSLLNDALKRNVYVSVIAAMETFLSETILNLTTDNKTFFRNFIESFPPFKDMKFELRSIYTEQERIQQTAQKAMLEIMYHNLYRVKAMYESTFNISFPDCTELMKCVKLRHDIVHRNGKSTDGKKISIDAAAVNDLITRTAEFAKDLAIKLRLNGN